MESNFNNRHIFLLLDAMKASLYWKDLNGRYLGCNAHCFKMAGLSSHAEILGKMDSQLSWYREARKIEKIDKRVFETGEVEVVDESAVINGERRNFRSIKSPLYDENKKTVGMVGLSFDITDLTQEREAFENFKKTNSHFIKNIQSSLADLDKQIMRLSEPSADNTISSQDNLERISHLREGIAALVAYVKN